LPYFPKKDFADWPEDATELKTKEVIRLYKHGFAGAKYDPDALARFRSVMAEPDGDLVAHKYGLADTGAGKLVLAFVHVLEMFPGCWPGRQGQARGDCVSWSTRNAALGTMVCDIVAGKPDEVSGKREEKPDVPPEGVADGVLSSEAIYWYRGYDGDGWHCPDAATVACKRGGVVLRKDYPELGVNLTTYSGGMAGKYGRRSPPAPLEDMTNDHLIHTATDLNSLEACRDFLFNGYFVSTCGGEGLSEKRDENGVSRRSGSWAHAMAYIGVDDRDWAKQTYGGPLVLDLNSWAKWNNGPRDIYDSAKYVPAAKKKEWEAKGIVNPATGNILIPEGSCWVRYSEMRNREMIAFSGVNGFPMKTLPYDPF
jgi:hypothetical protein